MGVLIVDAVHHRSLEHGIGADLQCAQRAGRIGGEDGVAGAAAEHNDLAALQRSDGLVAGEALGHLRHKGAGHNNGLHALLAQCILDGQRIHDGGQHADLVGVHAIHFAAGTAAPEVATAHNNADLRTQIVRRLDTGTDRGDGFLIKARALGAGKCLAADLQKNTFILNCHKNTTCSYFGGLPCRTGIVNHSFCITFYNNLRAK